MLNCEKCDYIKKASSKESKSIMTCGLTGFVFRKEFEDYEMGNHPCYNYSFQEDELEADELVS